jgi:hypothetical protein
MAVVVWLINTLRVVADFSSHILLLAELVFVAGIIFLGFGRSYGLPRLFWHEHAGKQGAAGFAAMLLANGLFFVSALLVQHPDFGRRPDAVVAAMPVREYLFRCVVALFVALLLPIWFFLRGAAGVRPKKRWPMAAGALGSLGLTVAFVNLGDWIAQSLSPGICAALPKQAVDALALDAPCVKVVHLHVLAISFFVVLASLYLSAAFFEKFVIPPGVGICILFGLLGATLGSFSFWLGGTHVLLVIGLIALIVRVAGQSLYLRRVPHLDKYYDPEHVVSLGEYQATPATTSGLLRHEDIPWRTALPFAQGKRPLVLVCASGGGLRAAVWTTGILCALERSLPGFPYYIRLISGASGGMFGAAAYVGTLKPPPRVLPRRTDALHTISSQALFAGVADDCLSLVTQRLVFRDLISTLVPRLQWADRGAALEDAFLQNVPEAFGQTFGDLAPGEAAGWRPSLVYCPMLAEDGRRLVISNLDLDFLLVQEGPRVGHDEHVTYSRGGYELARLFPNSLPQFPLRVATRLSASFPYLSPAAVLPTSPRRRVVDAGYWDNYGTSVACTWLEACVSDDPRAGEMKRWMREHVSGILLIQIRDIIDRRSTEGSDFRLEERRPPSEMERGLEGLTSPAVGALSARESAMLFRNDELVELVARRCNAEFGPGFFSTATFCFRGNVSLSWSLTEMEKGKLLRAAERTVTEQTPKLEAFWRRCGGICWEDERAKKVA